MNDSEANRRITEILLEMKGLGVDMVHAKALVSKAIDTTYTDGASPSPPPSPTRVNTNATPQPRYPKRVGRTVSERSPSPSKAKAEPVVTMSVRGQVIDLTDDSDVMKLLKQKGLIDLEDSDVENSTTS